MSAPNSRRVLVTGARGSVGRALCLTLNEMGFQVTGLVRPNTRSPLLGDSGVRVREADILDRNAMREAMQDCDVVMHLAAAHATAGASDEVFARTNIEGPCVVAEAAHDAGVQRMIHVSSIGVHGDTGREGVNEDSPFAPMDVYTRTKLEGELRVRRKFEELGLEGVVVRPLGIYGPGDLRFVKLFKGIKERKFPLIGRCDVVTQLCYIESFADIMARCATTPGIAGRVYIAGDPERPTVEELVHVVARMVKGSPLPVRLPLQPMMLLARLTQAIFRPLGIEPPLYPRRLEFYTVNRAADISRAQRELGFKSPKPFDDRIRTTAAWYAAHGLI